MNTSLLFKEDRSGTAPRLIYNYFLGDIVIIKDENLPRNRWLLARIKETLPSTDGKVRKARLRIATQQLDSFGRRSEDPVFLQRPIHKLVLLQKVPAV